MDKEALKELLFKMADDQLVLGHRNSEWTGLGPMLEEDIAFSSMAQDKIGHSYAMYSLLNELGERDPDTLAFLRNANNFKNSLMCELPNNEYEFSLMRHLLFDFAELIRFESLASSAYKPLQIIARKIKTELLYHTMHGKSMVKKLAGANPESKAKMQASLIYMLPFALGIFEHSPYENELIDLEIFEGEDAIKEKWFIKVNEFFNLTDLDLPDVTQLKPEYGGRTGKHTKHLQALIDEMSEVIKLDPDAEW